MTDEVIAAASAALGRQLHDLGGLGGSDRSGVHRASDGTATVVVKSYAAGSRESWARERVGLGAAGQVGVAPRLLASATEPPLVVMEDLGSAPSVADQLGSDPHAADDALIAWAAAIGRLHARTHAVRAETQDAFAEAAAEVADRTEGIELDLGIAGTLGKATEEWATNAELLGLSGPPDVQAVATPLSHRAFDALSPADACPDNNLLTAEGCRLIDFEWAEVRHPAWDAAYLTVPWPTCWCAWRIPDDSVGRALDAYREVASEGVPHVATDAFERDVDLARVCWSLVSVSWSLQTALRSDQHPHPASPGTRPRMQHRLGEVAASGTVVAAFAAEVLEHTRSRWGDLALALAPAYR